MGKFLLATLILALMFGASSTAQANLLTNPGFETSSFTGWTNDFNPINTVVSSANPQAGSWATRIFTDGGMLQQVNGIVGNQNYRLTGWSYVPAGGSGTWGSYIKVEFYDILNVLLSNYVVNTQLLTRGVYNLADTGSVVAPPAATYAKVKFGTYQSGGTPASPTDFDSFNFDVIPEPTSLLLLGAGLIGLVGLTKKRKA